MADLVRAKIEGTPGSRGPAEINRAILHLLGGASILDNNGRRRPSRLPLAYPDVLAGLKFDLNRPLGDGLDNNGNGVVDEPGENNRVMEYRNGSLVTNGGDPLKPDLDLDGTPDPFIGTDDDNDEVTDGLIDRRRHRARQAYARCLYVLMMTLMEPDFSVPDRYADNTGTGDPDIRDDESEQASRARTVAQWAINVVDFRDRTASCRRSSTTLSRSWTMSAAT